MNVNPMFHLISNESKREVLIAMQQKHIAYTPTGEEEEENEEKEQSHSTYRMNCIMHTHRETQKPDRRGNNMWPFALLSQ